MENEGLVSVIIPVYNVRPYIEEALDSVLAQSYHNLEILLIDDGSTDGSGEVCDRYAQKDGRIQVFHQENRVVGAARNIALDRMTGEMVAFLDPDDAYHPSFIEAMVSTMVREKVDVVICQIAIHRTVGRLSFKEAEIRLPSLPLGRYDRASALSALADRLIFTGACDKLYRRELWNNIRFVEGHVHEDLLPTYKIFSVCQAVYALNRPLYLYRNRPGSITTTYSKTNLNDRFLACLQVVAFVRDNTPDIFSPQQFKRVRENWIKSMISTYIRYCDVVGEDAFDIEARQKIIALGRETGIENLGLRTRAAYLMLCSCPWLLKAVYPAYHGIRMWIWKLTGR